MKSKIFCLLLVAVAFGGCIKKMPRQGDKAPVVTLADPNGTVFSTEKVKAKLLLLHFWTDWCKACREEFPKLEQAYQDLKPLGVEFVAVNIGQPASTSQKFREDFSITFPMLVDEKSLAKETFKITAYPTNYLIDSNGVILRRIVGWVEKSQIQIILRSLENSPIAQ